ncbi:MAG: glycoside hydrolase family 31 protein [Sphaerochaetaceae bacterium]|nr:glycoside hydrolase family 31 protein [Spirochaetales bacterium]MDY5498592.1 glycoside hydrolase family 31 protein [Sphaerochaetaceae bacterium]
MAPAATEGIPIDRALCLEYPEDPNVPTDSLAVQYGDGILKLLVVEQGSDEVRAYLPKGTKWYDPVGRALLEGGMVHDFRVPLYGSARYLLKAGSVVPTAPDTRSLQSGRYRQVDFLLQPGGDSVSYRYFEDDGSTKLERRAFTVMAVQLDAKRVVFSRDQGTLPTEGRRFTAILPEGFLFDGTEKRSQELHLETMPLSLSFHGSY